MATISGQNYWLMFLWGKIEPYVNAKITMRILMFHDAMIERGQIKPIEKPRQPELIEN